MTQEMEVLDTARRTISVLRNTVTVLQRRLEESETEKAGEGLTMEASAAERAALQEEVRARDALIAHMKEENGILQERWNDAMAMHPESVTKDQLSQVLRFYYRDFKSVEPDKLEREDAVRLYEVLKYLFSQLEKAKLLPKK